MNDAAFMTLMRLLPKSALSLVVGKLTRAPVPASVHRAAMRAFAKHYNVNLDEAAQGIEQFGTFSQFFTRTLKPGQRQVDTAANALVSPCDGTVSQLGPIESGRCLQAKGIWFPVDQLLGDARAALQFEQGQFITIYLSPRDYHRFHSPLEGSVTGYNYLPGEFWPVNPASVRSKDALFAINERLVTFLDTPAGRLAYIAVGATCVSRIQAAYDEITTHTGGAQKRHDYPKAIPVEKASEIGVFEMGSTVILLFEKGRVTLSDKLKPGSTLRMGERLGVFR